MIESNVTKYSDNPLFGCKNENGTYDWITYNDTNKF